MKSAASSTVTTMPNPNTFQQPFRFRLNCIDHYQATPTHLDPQLDSSAHAPGADAPAVPVIRVFGATETGQKVCAHIHGAFPYLYLEYKGGLEADEVKKYVQTLTASINLALALSYRRNPFQEPAKSYVAHISLVKGVPFYGYHVGYKCFLKVYIRNPRNLTRLADLLVQGAILAKILQPYESHLQYLLQWMCDYNLYGCALVTCARVRFRSPVPEFNSKSNHHQWHNKSISSEWISNPLQFPRDSHCDIELDLCVQDILNRHEVASRDIHHDFSERFLSAAPDEKYVPSMASLWKDESIRRKKKIGITIPGSSPFPPEALVTMSADSRLARGNWIHEEEYSKLVMDMIEAERGQVPKEKLDFDKFNRSFLGAHLRTTQESVEDLYPENLPVGSDSHEPADIHDSTVLVDETSIFEDLQDYEPSEAHQDSGLSEPRREPGDKPDIHPNRTNESGSTFYSQSHSVPAGRERRSQQKQVTFHRTGSNGDGTNRSNSPNLADVRRLPGVVSAESNSELSPHLVEATALLSSFFTSPAPSRTWIFGKVPPSIPSRLSTVYQDAHYSDESDIPEKPHGYAGMEVILESKTLPYLPYFDRMGLSPATAGDKPAIVLDKVKEEETYRGSREACTLRNWQISTAPPSASVVRVWAQGEKSSNAKKIETKRSRARLSQIEGPTQKQGAGSNTTDQAVNHRHETQYMSVMSLEVHVNTTGDLAPDPVKDEVACVFWGIDLNSHDVGSSPTRTIGILVLGEPVDSRFCSVGGVQIDVEYEKDELDLLNRMVDIVREFDPDILVGYEVHNGSWGFLIERARIKYEFDLPDEFSRMKSQSHGRFGKEADAWGFTQSSSILITGRHMINIWRSVRGDLNLLQYTLENVAFHVLQKRVPHYGFPDLTSWYRSKDPHRVARVMNYFLSRMQLNIEILWGNEVVSQTSEQARLLGVDFFSVISRGSQFKVESLMFRIAKPENYVLVSPSRKQVGRQNALECLPLVMEPQSRFYTSPLLVFDFQSLYPSVMIAYNYCYSTCLGRVADFHGQNKMGFTDFKRIPGMLELLGDHINIAPNGMMYARPELRKSLLAKMLTEILETRVMVKSGMKQDKDDKVLQLLLNNRQLALKLIANVTYGYTSASFSGRMPCAEIADSIVQTGRETLEKAIALIHSQGKWDAEVVYGDTDSLFVYLKGRSREEAFAIGKDIAETITNANPKPVKLKFEKMYHPCVLLAKKRYVGFKYETLDQREPDFDAKGIETVRRDGTPAEQKIEERALKILFTLQDLTAVKGYFQDQCSKIMSGRVSIQDFLFAKEVRLGTYSEKGPPPPGALVATKKMQDDARKEPQYGERVPYVVIAGAPGSRLIDRCVDPSVLLEDDQVELDADYYINKNLIPPLERIFSLVGANVRSWYDEMPKVQRARAIQILIPALEGAVAEDSLGNIAKKTLENYLRHSTCLVCHSRLFPIPPEQNSDGSGIEYLPICDDCEENPDTSLHLIRRQLQKAETRLHNVREVCRSCSSISFGEDITCDNRDCPVFYTRVREASASRSLKEKAKIVTDAFESDEFSAEFSW